MRFVRWIVVGVLLACPTLGRAAASLVIQETSRQPLDEVWSSIEATLSLEAANGLRALEVRAKMPASPGEELTLLPQSPSEGAILFPTKQVGTPPEQLFAIVFPSARLNEASEASIKLGSVRCRAARDAADPTFFARAVTADGRRVEVLVSYQRFGSKEPASLLGEKDLVLAPNPTLGSVEIRFRLATASPVEITVHDLRGRRIRGVFAGMQEAGEQLLRWDGRDEHGEAVPFGVYFLKLRIGREVRTDRVVLMR